MLCFSLLPLPTWFASQPVACCWVTACLAHLFVMGTLLYIARRKLQQAWHTITHMRFQLPEQMQWHPPTTLSGGAGVPMLPQAIAQEEVTRYPAVAPQDTFVFFSSIDDIRVQDWDHVAPSQQLFLQRPYLQAMERAPTTNTLYRYAVLYREQEPVGVATFQILDIPLEELGNAVNTSRVHRALHWTGSLHNTPDGRPAIRLLVCGNPLLSDSVSFAHTPALSDQDMMTVLPRMLTALRKQESQAPTTFVVVKDLRPSETNAASSLTAAGYHSLYVDPSMCLHIRPHWQTTDDYLNEMSSKYRQRYRAARKKGKALQRRSLRADEIERHAERLQELLDAVCSNAPFSLTNLNVASFVQLKRSLGETFQLTAYELNNKMVGFTAVFLPLHEDQDSGQERRLEAYLVGLDYDYNHSHKVYLNMLYDFVEQGIQSGVDLVHMGRTAWEIKSTVGAEACERTTYIRHHNPILNYILSPLLNLVPPTAWEPRNPFKEPQNEHPLL